MTNAVWGAWRATCLTLRETKAPASQFKHPIRSLFVDSVLGTPCCARSLDRQSRRFNPFIRCNQSITSQATSLQHHRSPLRSFHSHSPLASRPNSNTNSPNPDPRQNGTAFSSSDLSAYQLSQIFGTRVSIALGNRILKVLHGRRLSGTLDLDLPQDLARTVRPQLLEKGLKWLRHTYPVDEEAAILARIEREEQEEDNKVAERFARLGLDQPQSGKYGAELAEGGDVYGRSVLQDIRKTNEKANKKQEEDDRRDWLEGEEKMKATTMRQLQKSTELRNIDTSLVEARPRADPAARPALAWIQRHHVRATAHDWDTSKLTKSRRILPSLAVAVVTAGLCFAFAEWYEPPAAGNRIWPNIKASEATVIGLIGTNVAIFALWKCVPPAWRLLNRYFINTAMYPYSLSALGSTFSHQQLTHLGGNMLILWFVGTRLHEEIGRGDFVALYLSSGVFASLTSLSAHVIGNSLTVSSLGASGAIAGVIAAWCILHSDDKLTFMFLPREWQEKFSASGSTFLSTIVIIEALSLISPFRLGAFDYWAHLGGYAAGALIAWFWKARAERKREKNTSVWTKITGSRG